MYDRGNSGCLRREPSRAFFVEVAVGCVVLVMMGLAYTANVVAVLT